MLNQIDINLLIVLNKLLHEKHVSNTALSLHMSQSKVSRCLSKLRTLFNDDLLVRTQSGYELTTKAQNIQNELDTVLSGLQKLFRGDEFIPEESDAEVRFISLPTSANLVLPNVIAQILKQAPKMLVNIDSINKNHFDALLNSDAHFLISTSEPSTGEQDIYRMKLLEWGHSILMRSEHPLADKILSPEMLLDYPYGQISINGTNRSSLEPGFKKLGIERENSPLTHSIQLNDFSSAVAIAECTDIMFHVPDKLVKETCHTRNVILKEVPSSLRFNKENVYLYWHKRYHSDPMCMWVRSLFK